MSNLFVKDFLTGTDVHSNGEEILAEDFKEIMSTYINVLERKFKGYSYGEVDNIAKRASNIKTEVDKRELLNKIHAAETAAKEKLKKTKDVEVQRELKLQIQALSELKNKVSQFKASEHDYSKNDEKHDDKEKVDSHNTHHDDGRPHVLNLDVQ